MYRVFNQEVDIHTYSFSFNNRDGMRCFPKEITFDNERLNFEDGVRCLVQKGRSMLEIFNMTDGRKGQYRLSYEPERGAWKLLSMRTV